MKFKYRVIKKLGEYYVQSKPTGWLYIFFNWHTYDVPLGSKREAEYYIRLLIEENEPKVVSRNYK